MHILDRFLTYTKLSSPFKTENIFVLKNFQFLPDIKEDAHGNYYLKIGNSRSVFCCHLDTVSDKVEMVSHIFEGDFVTTDGSTILGADDRAGVTILTHMIENKIEGLYYFFIGEEVGCIGSSKASKDSIFKDYDRIIAFDRKHTTDVITKMAGTRTCSDEFATELSSRLNEHLNNSASEYNLSPCPNGGNTDSGKFKYIIPECTNISVGYFNEHTKQEKQNISYLSALAEAVIKIDWESLPIEREPVESSSSNSKPKSYMGNYSSMDEYYEDMFGYKDDDEVPFVVNTTQKDKKDNKIDEDIDVSAFYVEKMLSSDFNEFELKELKIFTDDKALIEAITNA